MRYNLILLFILLLAGTAGAVDPPPVMAFDANRMADAIYRAENSVKYPYGIRSIDTHGDKIYARKICLNSIRNAEKRWIKAGKPEDFVTFMGRRFSPPEQNPDWVKNVRYFLKSK